MRRLVVPAAIAVLAAGLVAAVSSASSLPLLRSATASGGHVFVRLSLGDLIPGRIVVGDRRTTAANGRLMAADIRLNEPLRAVKTTTGFRARTRHTLTPGTYYVQVSGTVLQTDCLPNKPCKQDWSNVLRVRVRRG